MARQQAVAAQDSAQRHGRNRSHEGDTEIRLPGSLDEGSPAQQQMQQMQRDRPPMRRNMTSYHLSRNQSHTKLKKNLSHGQLQRLNSKGNLAAMGQSNSRAPPSPGLKGKNKRPKSADMSKWALEKDLHEQEVELAQRIAEKKARGLKKVGFAVGSSGDSTAEELEGMEGAEMEEGDWTEESASASPYSTRQNTANNSRRTSVVQDRPHMRGSPVAVAAPSEAQQPPQLEALEQMRRPEAQEEEDDGAKIAGDAEDEEETETEGDDEQEDDDEDDDDDPPSPRSPVKSRLELPLRQSQPVQAQEQQSQLQPPQQQVQPSQSTQLAQPAEPTQPPQSPQKLSQAPRSPLHAAKQHPNPTMPFLRSASSTVPAPATTSNINALDNSHNTHGSPATSTMSARSTLAGDGDQDELVSRFIPSTSHPGSNPVTVQNTPKSSHFHTPEGESSMRQNGRHSRHQSNQPGDAVSPGHSTRSGSSGTVTPSIGRSRMELKMLQEKAMADINSVVDRNPFIPAHVYDRRNESLKSYLNLAALNNNNNANVPLPAVTTTNTLANSSNLSLGPEIFQGRFKAVHTELRVVQKFRDPFAESVARLRSCKGSKLSLRGSPQKLHAAALRTSKSAISLPAAAAAIKGKTGGGLHSRAVSGSAAEKGLSGSPVKGGPVGGTGAGTGAGGLQGSKSSVNVQQQGQAQRRQGLRGVSFAGGADVGNGQGGNEEAGGGGVGPEELVRKLWAEIGVGAS